MWDYLAPFPNITSAICDTSSEKMALDLLLPKQIAYINYNWHKMVLPIFVNVLKETTNDEKIIAFYSGLDSFNKFILVFNTLCPKAYFLSYKSSQILGLSVEHQFMLTLMKLMRNKED